MKNSFAIIMVVLFLTTSLIGCNMMQGMGKDVENAGEGIQKL